MMKMFKDTPLKDQSQDRFGRGPLVDLIVDSINSTVKDTHPCLVYGIYGKWGEGKTSLMNFVESRLSLPGDKSNLSIVHFNPWLVGNQDALLREYFSSVRKSVSNAVINCFDKYGALAILASETIINKCVPGFGSYIKLAKQAYRDSKDNLEASKKELSKRLADSGKHCLVMIDDVDRLDKEELHSLMRLVRQVADFDNFIYILGMDVDIVSKSIGSYYGDGNAHDGRKFIDKIVQIPIVLPHVQDDVIKKLTREGLTGILVKYGECGESEISQVVENIYPAIATIRDLCRLCNQLAFVLPHLRGEVNIIDLCVLEVIKMISNEAYMRIYHNKSALTREQSPLDYVLNDKVVIDALEERYDSAESSVVEGLDSLSKQTVLRLLRYLFGDKTNEAYYQSNLNNKRLCTDAYFYKYYIQAVPSNLIADTELDVVAQSQATMSVDELTTWIKAKCEKYDYGEIERSLVYLLYHCEKGHDQQVAASVVAKSLSSFFIKNSPIVKRYQMETSAFVAIQVLGEYLFIKDRDYSGFKIGNEALLNSTLTEIFSSADMNYAMNLLYYIYDYIAGSVKHISSSLAMLIDKFMSSTFEEQYSFSKDLLSRFFSCWKVVNLDSFVNYANEIFTNKDFPYVKVIDKFIDNKNEKSSGQDVNVFMDIFGPAKESIVCRMSEDPGAHSTQRLLTYFNELNRN